MFSRVMLFVIGAFVIGAVLTGFVYSQGLGNNFASTSQNPGHPAEQILCVGCVDNINLKNNSVTSTKIADNSVNSVKILDNTIIAQDVDSAQVCTQSQGCAPGWRSCQIVSVGPTTFMPSGNGRVIVPDTYGWRKCRTGSCTITMVILDNNPSTPPLESHIQDFVRIELSSIDNGVLFGQTPTNVAQKWRAWVESSSGFSTTTGTNGDNNYQLIAQITSQIALYDDSAGSPPEAQSDYITFQHTNSQNYMMMLVC